MDRPKVLSAIFAIVLMLMSSLPAVASEIPIGEGPRPLKIVHIGDSYSAGNGARGGAPTPKVYHLPHGCLRSPNNWGQQFANNLEPFFSVTYINRACSGAHLDQIQNGFEKPHYSLICSQAAADYTYERNRTGCTIRIRPQIESIDETVDIVLMTGGGNDVAFGDIIKNCFAMGIRDAEDCERSVVSANEFIRDGFEQELVDVFAALRERMRSDAIIVYLAYPHLVPDVGYALKRDGQSPYLAGDAIRELAELGEQAQRNAVNRANQAANRADFVTFVDDVKPTFEGHLPNPFQFQRRNPERWIREFETEDPREWYHYNSSGHKAVSELIAPFLTRMPGAPTGRTAQIDVVFVVDTTASMGEQIATVKTDILKYLAKLQSSTASYRIAVVSYRDYPGRTNWSGDYPAKVILEFTSDPTSITTAVNSLTLGHGGDVPETVLSGLDTAVAMDWRPGVTKIAVLLGDAPALAPEPVSGHTSQSIIQKSIAVDPVQVIALSLGGGRLASDPAIQAITAGTGGYIADATTGLTATIDQVIEKAANQPFAWSRESYVGGIGSPVEFNGSGSYDPSGQPLSLYEWDFDGDGVWDYSSSEPYASWVYSSDFDGFAVLRVTGVGGTALASSHVTVNAQGSIEQVNPVPCALDENGFSIFQDENGVDFDCIVTNFPDRDQPGVFEVYADSYLGEFCEAWEGFCEIENYGYCLLYGLVQDPVVRQTLPAECLDLHTDGTYIDFVLLVEELVVLVDSDPDLSASFVAIEEMLLQEDYESACFDIEQLVDFFPGMSDEIRVLLLELSEILTCELR